MRRSLRSRADFVRIQKGSLKASSAHYLFLVGASALGPNAAARLGIVVTKKLGNAVVRNRVKRTARETFRKMPDFVPNGIDLVVIARAKAETLSQPEVQTEWERTRAAVAKIAARVAPIADRHHVARRP
ncbi:MAG: ribonuclease P protein component [Polyangiaceae bacterium]